MRVHTKDDEVVKAETYILEKGKGLAQEILKELHRLGLSVKRKSIHKISLSSEEEYILSMYFSRNPKYMGVADSVCYGFDSLHVEWNLEQHQLLYLPEEKLIRYFLRDPQLYWEIKVTIEDDPEGFKKS